MNGATPMSVGIELPAYIPEITTNECSNIVPSHPIVSEDASRESFNSHFKRRLTVSAVAMLYEGCLVNTNPPSFQIRRRRSTMSSEEIAESDRLEAEEQARQQQNFLVIGESQVVCEEPTPLETSGAPVSVVRKEQQSEPAESHLLRDAGVGSQSGQK
jgi:hypothetical protein